MNREDAISLGIPVWTRMVEDAGGRYVGVQQSFTLNELGEEPMVTFLAPHSKEPLRLRVSEMTPKNVEATLNLARHTIRLVEPGIKKLLDEMRDTANRLIGMADQIEEELKNV